MAFAASELNPILLKQTKKEWMIPFLFLTFCYISAVFLMRDTYFTFNFQDEKLAA